MSDSYKSARQRMVETVAPRVDDDRVLEALEAVPRHEFVPPDRRDSAYADRPLPIGDGQTISAPHMVAIMATLLTVDPGDDVLEIGTGCGYHAAVTAELVGDEHVYSVEYGPALAREARDRLAELGYDGVSVRVGDGREGWPEHAPYDAAYFTCATPELPSAVVEQVRPGGQVIAPVGTGRQTLVDATKRPDGSLERTGRGGVRFVRLRG
ncbi:protein-L-isoaspartate(D-aspartate) O-methyltransferase [Natrinema sp. 74]|uniref:protein-L-isoaspartate(D-aspartate) O-methyltransferase n=1 Tax=Natrinema sp. 74 TaxID=3384159 RepID=UPI0038D402C0